MLCQLCSAAPVLPTSNIIVVASMGKNEDIVGASKEIVLFGVGDKGARGRQCIRLHPRPWFPSLETFHEVRWHVR